MRAPETLVAIFVGVVGALTSSCGGRTAEGFGSEPPPGAADPSGGDPGALRGMDPSTSIQPGDPACEAQVARFDERLDDALHHHLGASPAPVALAEVAGAAPGRPGRLAIALTKDAVRFRGWTFGPDEGAQMRKALGAEEHVAQLMVKQGAPDVRTVDLWVDREVSVAVLHAVLSNMPAAFEPRLVVALPAPATTSPAEPDWVSALGGDLASEDDAVRDGALAQGLSRAAPECAAVSEALTSSKLRAWNERDEFLAKSLGESARACGCRGIDLDAAGALALRAAGATGPPTGVFFLSRQATPLVQPKSATVAALAKALSDREAGEWRAPVALELASP